MQQTTTPTTELISKNDGLMGKVHEHLDHKLHRISTGRANPDMLADVRVEAYGQHTPLNQVGSVNSPDARTLVVQPWDKSLIEVIEKAVKAANLGLNPSNNGEKIIIPVPVPTEERRRELVKSAHKEAEHARVMVRNLRHEAMADLKKLKLTEDEQKDAQTQLDKLSSAWNKKVDSLVEAKEEEIMKV